MAKDSEEKKVAKRGPTVKLAKKNGKTIYSTVKVKSTGVAKTGPPKGEVFEMHPDLAKIMEEHGKVEIVGSKKEKGLTTT